MPSGEHERVGRDHRSVSEVRLVFEGHGLQVRTNGVKLVGPRAMLVAA